MTWAKPKRLLDWLLLAVPPASCVIATILGDLIDPREGNWMGWALAGLLFATLFAFCLSFWLARVNPTVGGKIGCAFICFVIFMVVNGAVSFAGCAAGSNFLPGMNFR